MKFVETFKGWWALLTNGEFGFDKIWGQIKDLMSDVVEQSDIAGWLDQGKAALNNIVGADWLYFAILLFVAFLMAFCGQKLIKVGRFISGGLLGYVAGATYLYPLISKIDFFAGDIWRYVAGGVGALLGFVLAKFIFWLVLLLLSGECGFLLAFQYVPELGVDKKLVGFAGAAVAALLFFLLLKFFERLLTSVGGAWLMMLYIKQLYDFTKLDFVAKLGGVENLFFRPEAIVLWSEVIVAGVLFLPAFVCQIKNRKKY